VGGRGWCLCLMGRIGGRFGISFTGYVWSVDGLLAGVLDMEFAEGGAIGVRWMVVWGRELMVSY